MFMDNLDRICEARGTSASAVCIAAGLSKNSPSNWRKSGAIPKEASLIKMAELLHCRVSDFFRDKEEQSVQYSILDLNEYDDAISSLSAMLSGGCKLDDNVFDFAKIYSNCKTARQRNQLMSAVYDFEDKVLNAEKETC